MRLRPAVRGMSVFAVALVAGGVAACGGSTPDATPSPSSSGVSDAPDPADARADLAARAALAQDHRFAALYKFQAPDQPARNVVATVANDGSWRVDIAGGALGNTTDVAIVSQPGGVFQCALPSTTNPISPSCVRVADPGKRLPKNIDPQIERVFRQWLSVFTDRQSALSVTNAQSLPGAQGDCWSIDSIQASLAAPVDVGIYCYAADGLLTAAKVDFGMITLTSKPVAPPAKVDLPGPVIDGPPLGLDAPAPPPSSDVASTAPPA